MVKIKKRLVSRTFYWRRTVSQLEVIMHDVNILEEKLSFFDFKSYSKTNTSVFPSSLFSKTDGRVEK